MNEQKQNSSELPNVLVVDDDETFRERLGQALRSRGYDVRTASNATQAHGLAREASPEWAVVDLRMPNSSGLDVLRDLKSLDAMTKVVVLTGYGSIASALDAIRLGATHYLTKPANTDEIIAAFHQKSQQEHSSPQEADVPSLARVEWEHIQRVLSDTEGNISEAARRLGLHRRSLQRKLDKYPPRR